MPPPRQSRSYYNFALATFAPIIFDHEPNALNILHRTSLFYLLVQKHAAHGKISCVLGFDQIQVDETIYFFFNTHSVGRITPSDGIKFVTF